MGQKVKLIRNRRRECSGTETKCIYTNTSWTQEASLSVLCAVQVNDVAFSPDESHFATCSEDGSVRVWSVPGIELVVQFQVLNQVGECTTIWNEYVF